MLGTVVGLCADRVPGTEWWELSADRAVPPAARAGPPLCGRHRAAAAVARSDPASSTRAAAAEAELEIELSDPEEFADLFRP